MARDGEIEFVDRRVPRRLVEALVAKADRLAALPVPLGVGRGALLAAQLGVGVQEAPISTHGRIVRGPDGVQIYVRPDLSGARRNFTVAHELGHLLVNETLESLGLPAAASNERDDATRHRAEERLCDFLAARLLMPPWHMARELARFPLAVASVFVLARECGVSYTAALIRVLESAPRSLALVRWRRPRFAPGAGLRADWVYRSPRLPHFVRPEDVGVPWWLERFANGDRATAVVREPVLPFPCPRSESVELIRIGRGVGQDLCALALG